MMTMLFTFVILLLCQGTVFNLFGAAYLLVKGCPSGILPCPEISHAPRHGATDAFKRKCNAIDDTESLTVGGGLFGKSIHGMASVPLPKRKSLLSRIAFTWVNDLLRTGNQRSGTPIELTDLWKLDNADLMGNVSNRFDHFYRKELSALNRNQTVSAPTNILQEFWSYPVTRAIVKM
jgi:hypothetical protein